MSAETKENRLKRLRMRSWRRGTKEMDLILGPFADDRLADLSADEIELYESLLAENDQDLYQWVSGQAVCPPALTEMLDMIRRHHGI